MQKTDVLSGPTYLTHHCRGPRNDADHLGHVKPFYGAASAAVSDDDDTMKSEVCGSSGH